MATTPREWTVLSMMEWATDYFRQKEVPSPRMSIEWLLADVLGIKRLDLYLKYDRPLSSEELDRLRPLVKRRAQHEPLQYITGEAEFHRVMISVDKNVLIPRIETEQLVEVILDEHPDPDTSLKVLDIGTGSGCIAIALAHERPSWHVTGIDASGGALSLARQNAERNEVDVQWIEGDLYKWQQLPLADQYDLIVSNPPYVRPDECELLEPQVREYEPGAALFCDDLPALYSTLEQLAATHLKKQGALYLEAHEEHTAELIELFDTQKWDKRLLQDYDKKDRFIAARLK